MLQLPEGKVTPRFARSQIAQMTRGGKSVKIRATKVKPDPIIKLIARADAALNAYTDAKNVRWSIEQDMDKNDIFGPRVYISDELLNVHWTNGYQFNSEKHIDDQFRKAMRDIRGRLKEYRESVQKLAKRKGAEGLKYERQQGVASCERKLALLPMMKEPLKATFRKEKRRIDAIHRKTGLLQARLKVRKATRELHNVTELMKKAKPTSTQGALELVRYVEIRLWCDKPGLFMEDGFFPSRLGPLLRSAHAFIKKATVQ
ncbi:hypothetical protein [Tardiphaga sp. 803_E3_N1_3]|uniref:hypothetical protein n=1 Tax=Tardiphaga sp. 803_E3_N1_3 TaxID=3240785 RepID=UPI003F1FCC61